MGMTALFLALTFFVRLGCAQEAPGTLDVAVGPQYDTTHVYVAPEDFDRFVASVLQSASKPTGVSSRRYEVAR